MTPSSFRSERGSVLPFVLVGLAVVACVAVAAYDASRFGLLAARSQADSVAALHAADSAVEAYAGGAGTILGSLSLLAEPGEATLTVQPLAWLPDSSRIVAVVAVGSAPRGAPRPMTRRIGLLVRVDSAGYREKVRGTWQELM